MTEKSITMNIRNIRVWNLKNKIDLTIFKPPNFYDPFNKMHVLKIEKSKLAFLKHYEYSQS